MPTYALVKDGIVENTVIWDGEGELFDGYTTVNIEGLHVGVGWGYNGNEFKRPSEPAPTHDEYVATAEIEKNGRITQANEHISSKQWPSKLSLGRLSDSEKESFNKWLDYIDALESVDTKTAPNVSWPEVEQS